MRRNYHMHTNRCMHAIGSDEDYVVSSIKGGFEVIGMSDHTPWNYRSSYVSNMRMPMSKLQDYLSSMRSLRDKYQDQIKILIGLECEYFEDYMDDLKALIEREKLDYVILGNHYYRTDETGGYFGMINAEEKVRNYVEETLKGMESGVYAYLAHPDLFLGGYGEFDEVCEWATRSICQKAEELGMIIEYNLGGVRYLKSGRMCGYPRKEFWEIASEYHLKAIVGVDAHNPKDMEDVETFDEAVEYLENLGLEVVEEIPLRTY